MEEDTSLNLPVSDPDNLGCDDGDHPLPQDEDLDHWRGWPAVQLAAGFFISEQKTNTLRTNRRVFVLFEFYKKSECLKKLGRW